MPEPLWDVTVWQLWTWPLAMQWCQNNDWPLTSLCLFDRYWRISHAFMALDGLAICVTPLHGIVLHNNLSMRLSSPHHPSTHPLTTHTCREYQCSDPVIPFSSTFPAPSFFIIWQSSLIFFYPLKTLKKKTESWENIPDAMIICMVLLADSLS
jgi:hypothetical protein